jgi:hypothetical protein
MEGTQSIKPTEEEMQTDKGSKKIYTIIVNTREKTVKTDEITFEQVVSLAFDEPPTGENLQVTVLYRRGHGNKEGTLVAGQSVKVKNGMVFDVTLANKS